MFNTHLQIGANRRYSQSIGKRKCFLNNIIIKCCNEQTKKGNALHANVNIYFLFFLINSTQLGMLHFLAQEFLSICRHINIKQSQHISLCDLSNAKQLNQLRM